MLLFVFTGQLAYTQVNCDINTDNINLCQPTDVTLEVQGNPANIQWFNSVGKIISTEFSTVQNVTSSTTFRVVNKIPFGSELIINGGFESGNDHFTSSYSMQCVNGTMAQGSYCITDNSGWFHPGWATCETPTKTGNMLVSDGAVTPNEDIWCQNVTVEKDKDYAFSAMITSVFFQNAPIMQFSINGELLGEPFRANDTPCEWQEFFHVWNSSQNTSANICIVNQNTEGEGNDFAIDNISLRETCYDIDSIVVTITDSVAIDLGAGFKFCPGDVKTLQNLASNVINGAQYTWSTGENTETIDITEPDTYSLSITTAEGCKGTNSITLTDIGLPTHILLKDTTICFIATPVLTMEAEEALITEWSHNNVTEYSSTYKIRERGLYNLVLSNGKNCSIRDEISITEQCSYNLYLPTAFSPNGDGKNDYFGPESFETYEFEFLIFNRWGQNIYSSSNLNEKWDGTLGNKKSPTGLYVYHIKYSVVDLVTNRLKKITKSGHFTLIR